MANILGFLILKIFGVSFNKRKNQNKSMSNSKTHPDRIELVYSGEDYFSRLEQIIQNVQYEIHLQFIF
jgi:hypothetical protein